MGKLFYAVMIQSGVKRFRVPDNYINKLSGSGLLSDRIDTISFGKIEGTLRELHDRIHCQVLRPPTDAERRVIDELVYFLHDLYVAANFRRPVVTVVEVPNLTLLRPILREDLCAVVEALLGAVQTLAVDAPVARFEVAAEKLKSFQAVMLSDLFESYVEGHAELALTYGPTEPVIEKVGKVAHKIVDVFPGDLELRKTTVSAIEALPTLIEAAVGKLFGAVAKPLLSALAQGLTQDRRLLMYSFHPTWRQIWGAKLDKVREVVSLERKLRSPHKDSS